MLYQLVLSTNASKRNMASWIEVRGLITARVLMVINIWHSWYLYKRNVIAKTQHIQHHIMVWVKPIWAYSVACVKELRMDIRS